MSVVRQQSHIHANCRILLSRPCQIALSFKIAFKIYSVDTVCNDLKTCFGNNRKLHQEKHLFSYD